jgi:shikimate kinase
MPGVGKTSVARAIADRWECEVLDTDDLVARDVDQSVAQFWRTEGESAFRVLELAALEGALAQDAVVATGGGVVTTLAARELLAGQFTVWLDCDDAVILGRLDDVDRPLLGHDPENALALLRAERQGWYAEVSRTRIDASATIEAVVALVLDAIERVAP